MKHLTKTQQKILLAITTFIVALIAYSTSIPEEYAIWFNLLLISITMPFLVFVISKREKKFRHLYLIALPLFIVMLLYPSDITLTYTVQESGYTGYQIFWFIAYPMISIVNLIPDYKKKNEIIISNQ